MKNIIKFIRLFTETTFRSFEWLLIYGLLGYAQNKIQSTNPKAGEAFRHASTILCSIFLVGFFCTFLFTYGKADKAFFGKVPVWLRFAGLILAIGTGLALTFWLLSVAQMLATVQSGG